MSKRDVISYSSEWHDPVDHLQLKQDSNTGDVYHRGSYYEEWRENAQRDRRWKRVLPYWDRLSKDPVRRGAQVRWIRFGVDPFDPRSLLNYALTAKAQAGRWLALHDTDAFGLLNSSCSGILRQIIEQDRSTDNQASALHCLSRVDGPKAEDDYIAALESKGFRYKFTPLVCIHAHGSARSVHAVCEYLDRSSRRPSSPHAADQWDTERSYAARFLDRYLDSDPQVEQAFKTVIRHWKNFAYQESRCILINVRYIGIRVLEPIEPKAAVSDGRTTLKAPAFQRRLWQDKERFRRGVVRPKDGEARKEDPANRDEDRHD